AEVDRLAVRAEGTDRHRVGRGRAAQLAEAHVDRHLAALEAGRKLVRARPALLALDAAARITALARAETATDALALLARLCRRERMQVELVGHLCVLPFDLDEMRHVTKHACKRRGVRVLGGP